MSTLSKECTNLISPSDETSLTRHTLTELERVSTVWLVPWIEVSTVARCTTFARMVSPGLSLCFKLYFASLGVLADFPAGSAASAAAAANSQTKLSARRKGREASYIVLASFRVMIATRKGSGFFFADMLCVTEKLSAEKESRP